MMFSNQELLSLWTNDTKRRAFVKNYKVWGVWFVQTELDLTYYKYDLPNDSGRIIAMEYFRDPYRYDESNEPVLCVKFYLQRGKCFVPNEASDYNIADCLKNLRSTLNAEQKQRDRQCRCGSRCFQHKQDGSIHCACCMSMLQGASA